MHPRRITRSAALGLTLAALAASTASAVPADLRSPDARDAARTAEAATGGPRQDLRSPDARDLAAGRGTFSAPEVTVVRVSEPSPAAGGLDWADAGIGAGGMLGRCSSASAAPSWSRAACTTARRIAGRRSAADVNSPNTGACDPGEHEKPRHAGLFGVRHGSGLSCASRASERSAASHPGAACNPSGQRLAASSRNGRSRFRATT